MDEWYNTGSGTRSLTSNGVIWQTWNIRYTANSGTATSIITFPVVNTLTSNDWAFNVRGTTGATTWVNWNTGYVEQTVARAQRIEATREQQERWERERLEREKLHEEDRKKRAAAEERAKQLLYSCLSDQQVRDLKEKSSFYINTPDGKLFRIDWGTHGNVKQLDPRTKKILKSYCVQPEGVPVADAMLAQKLWIEHDVASFERQANITQH